MKIPPYVVLDKKLGQTPLEAIQEWKAAHPEYADVPASYAGRLDPMATGLLLVLLGDECKQKEKYTKFDKEYEVEVLLDIGSDTGDVLGMATENDSHTVPNTDKVREILAQELGIHLRAYPAFSSKTVNGTPLFLHALQGTLDTIIIPEHEETFYRIQLRSIDSLPLSELQQRVKEMLAVAPKSDEVWKALGADFRIHEVRNSWSPTFLQPDRSYTVLTLRIICGSGAYMRTLAQRIGTALGTNALAFSIRRTRIGTYKKFGPLSLWFSLFKL
ncbi:MAG: tRNA pseudouridine55 synthase [Parcubacteria group bacterium]|nr:tRNA pseudouridine55 synthase [Parcubacteria group bacterium]